MWKAVLYYLQIGGSSGFSQRMGPRVLMLVRSSHQQREKSQRTFSFQENPGRRLRSNITVLPRRDSPQHIVYCTLESR